MNRIAIVSGSHREKGISHLVASRIAKIISSDLPDTLTEIISIEELPFWDEGMWGNPELASKWAVWQPVSESLKRADALIVISPEYHGMVPSRLVNFLLLCTAAEVGHKPALAVGVSSSRGGSYPISQLRSYGYKNNRICWIPDHLILRGLDSSTDPIPDSSPQGAVARYCIQLLDAYSTSLKSVRNSGIINHKDFPFGM